MRILPAFFAALLLAASASSTRADEFTPAQRQDIVGILRDALHSDPSIIRDALSALQADEDKRHDQVTRDVLSMLAPKLADPQDPVAGNPFGDVTIVEFYDTRCPYCRRMLPVMADLLRSDPKIRLVLKDLPILGNASQLESRALLAAQKQGGYFKMQEPVMLSAMPGTRDSLRAEADRQGLDGARMLRDMDDPTIKTRLQVHLELAKQIGIDGTPAFIVGTRLISGAAELKDLQQAVQATRKGS